MRRDVKCANPPGNQCLLTQRTGIIARSAPFFDRDADLVLIRRDIERRPPVACEYVLGHPALVSQLAGRVRSRQRYQQPHIRADASASRLQLIGLPETRSNNELLHEVYGVIQDRYVHPCNHRRGVRCQPE